MSLYDDPSTRERLPIERDHDRGITDRMLYPGLVFSPICFGRPLKNRVDRASFERKDDGEDTGTRVK